MRILVLASTFPPHVMGGAEVSTYNLCCLLAKRGHKVSVLTMCNTGEAEVWGETMTEGFRLFRVKFPRAETLFGYRKLAKWQKPVWHLQDYADWRSKRIFRKVLAMVRPEHVNIHLITGLGYNLLEELGRHKDVSVTYFLHDLGLACIKTTMFTEEGECKGQCKACDCTTKVKNHFLRDMNRLAFVSPSRANLERVQKFVPEAARRPGRVIRNLLDEMPPLPAYKAHPKGTVRIMLAGRLHPTKGVDVLLRALVPLADKHDFHVTLYGQGEHEAALKAEFGDKPWVTFAGFVDRSVVAEAISQSELYCMPSIWPETFGRGIVQALCAGTPVFGSNVGGIPELVEDGKTGRLLPPGDVDAWREALDEALSDKTMLTKTWRRNAEAFAREYSADGIAASYEALVDELRAPAAPVAIDDKPVPPMKMLIMSPIFPPHVFGGAEICAYDMARHFVKRGHDVTVMTMAEDGEDELRNGMTEHGFRLYRVRFPRAYTLYKHTEAKPWQKPLWHLQNMFDRRNERLLAGVLDEVKPDHILAHSLMGLGYNMFRELGRRDLPVTYVLHDIGLACIKTTMFKRGQQCDGLCTMCACSSKVKNQQVGLVERLSFISPSAANLRRVAGYLPNVAKARNFVIKNMPDDLPPLPPYKPAKDGKVRILYAGRLTPSKGIRVLMDALHSLPKELNNFHLTILGKGDQEEELRRDFGHLPWVTFGGFVTSDTVLRHVTEAEVMCVPSIWPENYSRSVIQSLCLGTPVIGSEVGGIPEQIEDGVTGLLLPAGDVAAWREAMERILREPDLLQRWRKQVTDKAGAYKAEDTLAAYERVMRDNIQRTGQ